VSAPCPDANQLAQLADGTLPAEDREHVEQHFDHCTACGELVAELAWSIAPDREPPPGFRIVARAGDDRYAAIGPDGDAVELCAVSVDHAPLAALVGAPAPHVVPVLAVERAGDTLWIATAPTATPRTLALATWHDALAGVRQLHRRTLVHGAISDASVRIDAAGCAGIDPVAAPPPAHFLAPERLHGGPPSRAADQFALCVGMWQAVAGQLPYTGATPGALAVAMQVRPRMPADRDTRVLRVLARGLAFDPAQRWPDLEALAAALAGAPSRRAIAVMLALAAGLVLALAAILAA